MKRSRSGHLLRPRAPIHHRRSAVSTTTAPQSHHRCGQIDSLAGPRAGGQPYAIVEAFNPALQARSIGDSLFGNANKWGKMPITMYVLLLRSVESAHFIGPVEMPVPLHYNCYLGTMLASALMARRLEQVSSRLHPAAAFDQLRHEQNPRANLSILPGKTFVCLWVRCVHSETMWPHRVLHAFSCSGRFNRSGLSLTTFNHSCTCSTTHALLMSITSVT